MSDDALLADMDHPEALEIQLAAYVQLAFGIPVAALERALQARQREETILPILDPTRYRDETPARESTIRILTAFLAFRRVLDTERAPP